MQLVTWFSALLIAMSATGFVNFTKLGITDEDGFKKEGFYLLTENLQAQINTKILTSLSDKS